MSAKSLDHIKPPVQQSKPALPKELDGVPALALPTAALASCVFAGWLALHVAYGLYGVLPYPVFLPLAVALDYWAFTPAHDAVHNAIASRSGGFRWLNDTIGWLSTLMLCAPFPALRAIHLRHHRYTNVPGVDPDLWASGISSSGEQAPWWTLPFRWLTITQCYLYHYVHDYKNRPTREFIITLAVAIPLQGIAIYPLISFPEWYQPTANYLYWSFYLPAVFALAWLACVFDYIPHRPSVDQDIYKATLVTALSVDTTATSKNANKKKQPVEGGGEEEGPTGGYDSSSLSALLLYQNYHLIHHLYPWVPFYRYSAVWYKLEGTLRKKGSKIKALFPIFA